MKRLALGAALASISSISFAQFTLLAVEATAGSNGGNTAAYGGVQQYAFAATGGTFTPGPGLPASQLHDPAGIVVMGHDVFVSNRHGNTLGLGSVQQFAWNGTSLSGGTTIAAQTSSLYAGWHGFTFSNGDLFVTTANGGTRRYRDSGSGYVEIGGVATGPVRDVTCSADGTKMYEVGVGGSIRVTQVLPSGFGSANNYGLNGASSSHQMAWRSGSLFVTGFNSSTVHRVDFDANGFPVSSTLVASPNGAIGIAFSPDLGEMFVASHTGNRIYRYLASGTSWVPNGEIATGKNMGWLGVVQNPGTLQGRVDLQGVTGPCMEPADYMIMDGSQVLQSGTITLGPGGAFNFPLTLAPGEYTIAFNGRTHLWNAVTFDYSMGYAGQVTVPVWNGDIDRDNEVGPGDFGILAAAYLSSAGDPNWNPLADIDCDGEVGPGDFGLLANNFLSSGWTP